MPERRDPDNYDLRERIECIDEGYQKISTLLRNGLIVVGVACVISIALSYIFNQNRIDQINEERYVNTYSTCLNDSRENAAIQQFLEEAGTNRRLVRRAEVIFPVLSEIECRRNADKRVEK